MKTLKEIANDINKNGPDAEILYFATEQQIAKLIDSGKISEDAFSWSQTKLEEMRCMMAEFA